MTENILTVAERLTSRDRQQAYRHPREHFKVTVGMLNALFAHKLREPLTVDDWPRMLIVDKLARSLGQWKPDNPADIAGYARTWQLVVESDETPCNVVDIPGAFTGK